MIGIFGSAVAVVLARESRPFLKPSTNVLLFVANIEVAATFFSAALLLSDTVHGIGLTDFQLGALLLASNLAMFVLVGVWGVQLELRERVERKQLEDSAVAAEWAVGFSDGKFRTTFAAFVRDTLPASHVVGFQYLGAAKARSVARAGLPAVASHGGVLFTLHGPHEIDQADRKVFPNRQVCLVCALPRWLLVEASPLSPDKYYDRKSGSGRGGAFWLLSSEVIRSLRPTAFSKSLVIDPDLWIDGSLLLPPKVIKRGVCVSISFFFLLLSFLLTPVPTSLNLTHTLAALLSCAPLSQRTCWRKRKRRLMDMRWTWTTREVAGGASVSFAARR